MAISCNDINHTFPSSARDDGSDDHETLLSVHFLLVGTTLTKSARFRLVAVSEDFFMTEGRRLADLSESSVAAFALFFFMVV